MLDAVLLALPPAIRLMVLMPAPAGPMATSAWLPTTATAAQAAMPAAQRFQWGNRTALPFFGAEAALSGAGADGCMASRRAFRSSGACSSSTSILYSPHFILDLLLQHGM